MSPLKSELQVTYATAHIRVLEKVYKRGTICILFVAVFSLPFSQKAIP